MPNPTEQETLPGDPTQPYSPIFTGEFSAMADPVQPLVADRDAGNSAEPPTGLLLPVVHPEVVAGTYQHLKRWTFVLVVAGVWIAGAACGWGLYYWWFHSLDKTPPVFVVLIFVILCTLGGVLAAMVVDKPLVAALAIGLMSAPLAALGAAAVLHGTYFCQHVSRCLVGLIPY
ncbi:hypothetical protein ACGFK1_21850 [Mycobacterium sp. NPDC048908]|uniref:hypothetical protein n=1 Tax=Mycobacterium sp. NPDC048908 TaxID=3364292 RepID=UPI00371D830A